MLLPRPPLLSALLLLLLAACRCTAAALLRGAAARTDALPGHAELSGRSPRTRTESPAGPPAAARGPHHGPVTNHRDPQHKEKFIIHLTGPLSFDPKCRKQFNRLYHSTRDCTVPAYYRRCARLLIQLAKSPRCADR